MITSKTSMGHNPSKSSSSIFQDGRIRPGVYKIRNIVSRTYVDIKDDVRELCGRPSRALDYGRVQWDIQPLGSGYTIRKVKTSTLIQPDQYCAMLNGIGDGCAVSISDFPVAWKIEAVKGDKYRGLEYVRIFWGSTNKVWDLAQWGSDRDWTKIRLKDNSKPEPHRIWELVRVKNFTRQSPPSSAPLRGSSVPTKKHSANTIHSIEEPAPAPAKKPRPQARKKHVVVLEEDAEMDDLESVGPGPSKTPKKRKGDLQSEGKKSAGVVKTRGEQADARVSGSKRVLQDPPTRVEVPAKRLRVGGKSTGKRVVSTDINLGEYTFDEDSVINPELVPRVVGKVCDYCTRGERGRTCSPIWHLKNKMAAVRCKLCLTSRQGCSFQKMDWGITEWPTIVATEAGKARRAGAVNTTRKKPSRSEWGEDSMVGAQESISTHTTRSQGKGKKVTIAPPAIPEPSGSLVVDPIAVQGRSHQVIIEPLLPYLAILSDPSRSGMDLRLKRIELRAIQRREAGESLNIANMVDERGEVINKLIRQMDREILQLGSDLSDGGFANTREDSDDQEEESVGSDIENEGVEEDGESDEEEE